MLKVKIKRLYHNGSTLIEPGEYENWSADEVARAHRYGAVEADEAEVKADVEGEGATAPDKRRAGKKSDEPPFNK